MSRLHLPNIAETEERKCVYLLPVKVAAVFGDVKNAEALLRPQKYYQINISDYDTAELSCGEDGREAGILLDMGREIQGGVRVLCSSTDNYTDVLIRFGESVGEALTPLGEKNTTNDHAIREFSVPFASMSDQTWGQTGYRFVYIGLQKPGTELSLKSVLGAFMYRDLDYRGSFRCSDELLNRIFDVSAYTCHLCLQNYLWDGIKRDRLVWIGDSHPEMLTTQAVFGRLQVFEDSIDEARDAYPLPQWINGMPSYSLWWMIILHDQYVYTGDRDYLTANREYLTGITKQVTACVDMDGELDLPSYFIDWPNHNTPAEKNGVKALCAIALEKAAALLTLLGDTEDAGNADAAAKRLRAAGADCSGSKSTEAMAWLAGFDSDEKTAAILLDGGAKGCSTFFSYYILSALFGTGRKQEALDILKTYYGGMLDMGATTFWEDFNVDWMENSTPIDRIPEDGKNDIHGDFGAFCYVKYRHSLCHGWSSGPAPFLLHSVLGISVDNTGEKTKVTVAPQLCGLSFAEGTYPLPDGGEIKVRAENIGGKLSVTCDAPENVTVVSR